MHNTFYRVPEGVVGWDTLGAMDVRHEVIRPLRTILHVDNAPEVKALDGQEVELMGFLFPLEGGLAHERFLLTAWPPGCPFFLPAGPSQIVEVLAQEPVAFTDGAIVLAGRCEVLNDDRCGMYYRMHGAEEVARHDHIRWTGRLPAQPSVPE